MCTVFTYTLPTVTLIVTNNIALQKPHIGVCTTQLQSINVSVCYDRVWKHHFILQKLKLFEEIVKIRIRTSQIQDRPKLTLIEVK